MLWWYLFETFPQYGDVMRNKIEQTLRRIEITNAAEIIHFWLDRNTRYEKNVIRHKTRWCDNSMHFADVHSTFNSLHKR